MLRSVNLAEFAKYVGYDISIWQQIIGQDVEEVAYGAGVIKRIEVQSLHVEFKQGIRVFPLSLFVGGYKGIVLSLSYDLDETLKSLREQKKDEISAVEEFINLKTTYLAEAYKDPSPTSPLYMILLQMQAGERLATSHLEWLELNKLYGTLALYWQDSFRQSRDPWDLVKASSYWRSARQPNRVLTLTDYLLNKGNLTNNQLLSAILTTRGGALRDLGNLDSAEQCAYEALKHSPSSFQPHNLLGAIYFTLGKPDQGEEHFNSAVKLGAQPRLQDAQMRSALDQAGELERAVVAKYLLQKDAQRYKWAASYSPE